MRRTLSLLPNRNARAGARRRSLVCCLAALLPALASAPALAQTDPWSDPPPDKNEGFVSVRGGFGFTADPSAFMMSLGVPVAVNANLAFSPDFMLAIDDDELIVAPGIDVEFRILGERTWDSPELRKLTPVLRVGTGLAYIEKEQNRGADEDGTGWLLRAGMGVEYEVTEDVHLGSHIRFNILPVKAADERFFFSWDILSMRFDFP
ncbi:MAG: hypothetical protein ACQGVK_15845 [Myxococcota bacterium]